MTDKEFLTKAKEEKLEMICSMVEDAKAEVFRSVRRGIEQSKARQVEDLGDFSKYIQEDDSDTMGLKIVDGAPRD